MLNTRILFSYSSIREEGSCDGTPTPEGLPDRYSGGYSERGDPERERAEGRVQSNREGDRPQEQRKQEERLERHGTAEHDRQGSYWQLERGN